MHIVCATRGGEISRRTQEAAISLANEKGAALTFLYVVDPSPYENKKIDLIPEIEDELVRLGRSLMHIARARARNSGVTAEIMVCKGDIGETIESCLRELKADLLVIGAPRSKTQQQVFQEGEIDHFARQIGEDTGVQILVVR